ncbi:MAG: integrase core domain-containing protein [Thermoplasmatales archaeon]|nr:MAG: integrase core domain-containing protein [Thermoplasmatales archaeon]
MNTVRDGMVYLLFIKDCFSKKWQGYHYSRSCMARDAIRSVENAVLLAFNGSVPEGLVLRTDNGPQYISREFRESMKLLGIRSEYIQKHTPEDNGDLESFHNSLKTDYIWVNDLETFQDAENLMEYAFNDYNSVRLHSSIEYLPPDEFERRLREKDGFKDKFLVEKKRKEEKGVKNRIERKRKLMEDVSMEDGISVQN